MASHSKVNIFSGSNDANPAAGMNLFVCFAGDGLELSSAWYPLCTSVHCHLVRCQWMDAFHNISIQGLTRKKINK